MRLLPRFTRRRLLGAVAVVAVLGSGLGFWLSQRGSGTNSAANITYRQVAASLSTVRESVSTTGTVEPADQESLNFGVSGTVTAVDVAEGDRVRKGQALAHVDSAEARATLASAKATLADAQSRLDADTTAGDTSTQLTADRAAVTAAEGQVSSARDSLAAATLTSPIDGVVATVDLTVGQQVSGSGSGGGSAPASSGGASTSSAQLLVISDNSWIVDATVDDTQVGLLAKGDQAQIVPGSDSSSAGGAAAVLRGGQASTTAYGTITSIGLIASSNSSGVASFPVVVTVTGNPSGLHAGATATVTLIYKQLTNVLTVPTTAVRRSGGSSYVLQSTSGKQVQTRVSTGLSSGGVTQITKGLAEGDQVLVPQVSVNRTGTTSGNNSPRGGFGGGGFGGGGFGGSGFGGGGFGG